MPARSKAILALAAALFGIAITAAGVLWWASYDSSKYKGFDPGDPPITNPDSERQIGGALAVGYNKGNDKVALRINGYPVTTAEVLEAKAGAEVDIVFMRSLVSRLEREGVPYVQQPSGDYSFISDGVSTVPWELGKGYVHRLAVAEKYGPDTMALASLVTRYAPLTQTIKAGHSITDTEVKKLVKEKREIWDKTIEGYNPYDNTYTTRGPRTVEYIRGVGEETYWNDIAPKRVFYEHTFRLWTSSHLEGLDVSDPEWRQTLTSLHEAALVSVELEFTKHYKLDASLEDVRAYLQERDE